MRSLGYPRLISMENFRNPNFELVADCLYWLLQRCGHPFPSPVSPLHPHAGFGADGAMWGMSGGGRYDPGTDVSDDISTESDRVLFLKSVAQVMLTKSRIKLNIKRLYAADGLAVKELLKVALLLYKATSSATDEDSPDDLAASTDGLPAMNSKLFDAKVTRQLASEITQVRAERIRPHTAPLPPTHCRPR